MLSLLLGLTAPQFTRKIYTGRENMNLVWYVSMCANNPICATNQELNLTELVSSLSVCENHYLSASIDQPIKSRILLVS